MCVKLSQVATMVRSRLEIGLLEVYLVAVAVFLSASMLTAPPAGVVAVIKRLCT